MIVNEASIHDKSTDDLRAAIEHRATWFYYLIDEAMKRGLDLDFASQAILRCGAFHGLNKFPRTDDLLEFTAAFANEEVVKVFEMDVKAGAEETNIEFHYCPLVEAWKKLGVDDEMIDKLCDIAMDGDRGIISEYDKFEFELGDTIAKGCPVCQVKLTKVNDKEAKK